MCLSNYTWHRYYEYYSDVDYKLKVGLCTLNQVDP
jgi:hypothetical protein